MNWIYIPCEIDYGKERRKIIMDMFNSVPDAAYSVNCKYRPQMKDDPDLRKLIKQGKLKIERHGTWRSRKTYLVKT